MSTATEGRTATALRYFQALADRDAGAMAACWRPGGIDRFVGQADLTAPDEVRDYFQALFDAFPDLEAEVLQTTTEGNRCAVRWRVRGTFAGPGSFQGLEPNGARVEMEGCDVVEVEDGQVVGNSAYMDGAAVARQIGALPAQGSPAERRLAALFNRGARLRRRIAGDEPEAIADGVWIVRGGFPMRTMNCYLIRDGAGVCVFDAGIHSMAPAIAAAGARLGGITRVVLGHAHPDHRGAAAALDAPVYCHPADRADAEGDGGMHYFDLRRLDWHGRLAMPRLLPMWDGGPVAIAGTVEEGDPVAGFRVIELPGHSPGMIGLWRAHDRLALTSDCFYVLDPQTGRKGAPRLPHPAFNYDTEQARASLRRLAAMEPDVAWPGHADALTGDVRAQLEQAAATT